VHGVQDGIFEVVGSCRLMVAHGRLLPVLLLLLGDVIRVDSRVDFGQWAAGETVPSIGSSGRGGKYRRYQRLMCGSKYGWRCHGRCKIRAQLVEIFLHSQNTFQYKITLASPEIVLVSFGTRDMVVELAGLTSWLLSHRYKHCLALCRSNKDLSHRICKPTVRSAST
jgi:hypothetical protein